MRAGKEKRPPVSADYLMKVLGVTASVVDVPLRVTSLAARVQSPELTLPAAEPDAPTHDVKRQENQRKDENQERQRTGGDVHAALIGMTLGDFRQSAYGWAQYNAAITSQLYMIPEGQKILRLFDALTGSSNASGGWGYQPNKASRLEPTAWALLAIGQSSRQTDTSTHRAFLEKCVLPAGYLVEDPQWPTNVAFNAVVAFTWLNHRGLATEEKIRAILGWLSAAKGVQAPQS